MGRKSRQEKEVKRLAMSGHAVSAIRRDIDVEGREYHVAATLHRVGAQYHVSVDAYYLTGVTGETIWEENGVFSDVDAAIRRLLEVSGIPLHEFK